MDYPEVVNGDVHGSDLNNELLLPEWDLVSPARYKQPVQFNVTLAAFLYYYYIRLTAFFQDNPGKPAPER